MESDHTDVFAAIQELFGSDLQAERKVSGDILHAGKMWRVRIHFKPEATKVVFLLNGAVNRSKAPGPILQRSSWTDEINGSCINIADRTLVDDPEMSIGWAQGDGGRYLYEQHSLAVAISDYLGMKDSRRRIYFGSSAGGFQALSMASLDKGSTAIVNNPQVDWTRYYKSVVDRVRESCFQGATLSQIRNDSNIVTDVGRFMKSRSYVPKIQYYVNSASRADVAIHLHALLTNIRYVSNHSSLRINHYYDEESGHNPMNKEATISAINEEITQ
ncbi:hypothetical protein [Glutamicibacter sp. X7]